MRIGHLSTFYHTAVMLMSDPGTGEKLGTEPEWRLFGTGPAIVEAFGRGELDLAYIGLPPAIIGIASGVAIKCIAGGHVEGTLIAGPRGATAYPEAGDAGAVLGQFRGRTVGVPGKGSIHDVILADILEQAGLEDDIRVKNFRWADLIIDATVRGEVACAIGTPALAVALGRYAGGQVLYPPHLIWPQNPSYGIVASAGFLKDDAPAVEGFVRLHEEASRSLRETPEAAAGAIASFVGTVDAEFVLDTIRLSPRYCAQLSKGFVESTMRFVPALRRLGYIGRELEEREIFDHSVIQQAHPPGDHY